MKSFPYAITDTFSYRRIYTDEPNDTTDNQNKCRCFGIEFDSGSFEQQYMTGLLIRDSYTDRAILINECGISQLNGNYPLDEDEIELYANECWLANGQTYDLTQKADKTDLDAKLNTSDSITNDEITTLFS